jgi:hypothetical protein
MRCHFLGVLERAAVGEVGGDTGGAERVAANRRRDAGHGRGGAGPLDGQALTLAAITKLQNYATPRAG